MNQNIILTVFITFVGSMIYGQSSPSQVYLEGPLENTISNYIVEIKESAQKFEQSGYIEVEQTYYNANAKRSEVQYVYNIKEQNFKPKIKSEKFPRFYSQLEGKIILLYFPNLPFQPLSASDKEQILQKLIPFLNEVEHIVAKNEKGEIIIDDENFREESFNIHGGIQLKIFADGSSVIKKNL